MLKRSSIFQEWLLTFKGLQTTSNTSTLWIKTALDQLYLTFFIEEVVMVDRSAVLLVC